MSIIDSTKVNSYLYWGYVPSSDDEDYFKLTPVPVDNLDINLAGDMLANEIAGHIQGRDHHVIPMSGGLDSRLILCELLHCVPADRISLFTFGIPGSYDYEIPGMIAKKLGIQIERVDLNKVLLDTNKLVDSITPSNMWTYLFDSYYNRLVFKLFGKDVVYWSGFMGNNLAGEHLDWYSGPSWEVACDTFIMHERRCNAIQLYSSEYDPKQSIMMSPDGTIVPYIDQLDFRHRQPKCILSILNAPSKDYKQVFPLTSKPYMNYMMGLPFKERKGEVFYRNLIMSRCKALNDIPVKRTYCLPLQYEGTLRMKIKRYLVNGKRILMKTPSPMLNYYDFNTVFRERDDLRSLLETNLLDLSARRILPWLNIDLIKRDFFEAKKPIHDAISTLVSLELYLKYEGK